MSITTESLEGIDSAPPFFSAVRTLHTFVNAMNLIHQAWKSFHNPLTNGNRTGFMRLDTSILLQIFIFQQS
jgi:hypothetical protein